ncbi:hypothetical protein BCEN4_210002 [Burkholderia cenocepacia]|nr:hypothetical protein BCEN4_210002 [Burkholderia cenocepacia]
MHHHAGQAGQRRDQRVEASVDRRERRRHAVAHVLHRQGFARARREIARRAGLPRSAPGRLHRRRPVGQRRAARRRQHGRLLQHVVAVGRPAGRRAVEGDRIPVHDAAGARRIPRLGRLGRRRRRIGRAREDGRERRGRLQHGHRADPGRRADQRRPDGRRVDQRHEGHEAQDLTLTHCPRALRAGHAQTAMSLRASPFFYPPPFSIGTIRSSNRSP